MLDIPSISAIIATVDVIVGVAIAILQLRDLVKTRQTDFVIRLYSTLGSNEVLEAGEKLRTREYTDLNGYLKNYGLSEVNKVAKTVDEARELIEAGFEYVTDMVDVKLFRKRK